ncbi:MAG: antitoxin [Mycobacteriales bacterium]
MKTTLDLPDELVRAVKIRAVNEGRRLKDVMADLIRCGLARETAPHAAPPTKVQLPLIRCAHPARTEDEVTPDRAAEILHQEEARLLRNPR